MRQPIEVTVDAAKGYAHIAYADRCVDRIIDVFEEGIIAAELDDSGNIFGIELGRLDVDVLERAKAFAKSRDLAFPDALLARSESIT